MQVLQEVLQKIKPSKEERELVERIKGELLGLVREEIERAGLEVKPYFVGSLAKDTYLAGDHDIDLFLAFPLDVPLNELREEGFNLAEAIGKRLDSYEKAYAEHPYISGRYRGFDVDLVPCYDVNSWREVRTAVDRSILHNRWVLKH
ncbi:nucleotidyltransferase domain-containing protein, partial [Palaeococcus sp. (in: euryarchaeotes)]